MPPVHDELTQALLHPEKLIGFDLSQWDILIRKAKRAGLLARIECLLAERDLLVSVPEQPSMHLNRRASSRKMSNALCVGKSVEYKERWKALTLRLSFSKAQRISCRHWPMPKADSLRTLTSLSPKTCCLKWNLRSSSMVGNRSNSQDTDQLYYRTWAHELPPLRHRDRNTVVDVHHTILPLTGRLHPDAAKLLAAAEPLLDDKHRILAPSDMLLHSAAHMFQDGDLRQALRELVDIDELVRHFSRHADFWDQLFARAVELDLSRPLYYALRYSHKFCRRLYLRCFCEKVSNGRP